MNIRYYLERMTTSLHSKDSLQNKLKEVGIKTSSYTKANMVSLLEKFYSFPSNIKNAWNMLNSFEKDLMEEYIRNNYMISTKHIDAILQKHKRSVKKQSYFYSHDLFDYIDALSPMKIFFLPDVIPPSIKEVIEPLLSKTDENITPVKELKDTGILTTVCVGESFEKDMVGFIKLVNSTKIKINKDGRSLGKASIQKVNDAIFNKEFLTSQFEDISEIKNYENTNKINGLVELLSTSKIIAPENEGLVLGENSGKFLNMNVVEKSKYLLQNYINSVSIFELTRVKELKIHYVYTPQMKQGREIILSLVSKCPLNEWIDVEVFKRVIKTNNIRFIMNELRDVEYYDNYGRYYSRRWQDWHEIEGRIIDIVLIEFLSTLGIIDIVAENNESDFTDTEFFTCKYLRLTPFGAYILGRNNDYKYVSADSKSSFVVQPNFEIHVLNGSQKDIHDLFFDNYTTKIKDDMVSIYRLEFKALVKALDMGLDLQKLIDYLVENAENELPQNVKTMLEMWKEKSTKIYIRKVTIVETEDVFLMEELKSYKPIKSCIKKDLPYVFEISQDDSIKVKREIEKKNHFCMLNNS